MTIKTNLKKFWAYNEIFDVLGNKLKPNGIAVYLCLIRHANNQNQCYPSFKLIAEKCGMSRMTVIRTIDKLIGLDLIQVQKRKSNKGDYSSNLYTIKELPETSDKIDTQGVISESDHPSITKLPPVVSESDHPSITELPKGQKTEGQLYLKDDDTKDGQAPNNEVDLPELKSPINISEQLIKSLSKLEDNNKRQEVLDVLAVSMKKGAIRKPEAYLQTLIQRSLADDFTPIKPQKSLKDKVDSKQEQKKAIEQCPYCNQSGYIHIRYTNGNFNQPRCSHPQYINWDKDDIYEIRTASSGHKSKEEENRELISKNKSTVKQRNVAELLRQVIKKIPVYESDDPNKNYTSEEYVPF
jgi:predicted transcriptional regulator